MCGFLQVFEKGRPVNRDRFEEAFALIEHRGPDDHGTRFAQFTAGETEIHVASGHHRLSILDLDKRSAQPFVRGRDTLLYNGEIYNYRDLRDPDTEYTTEGDTEVLFEALRKDGLPFLDRANGMWAFTFLDEEAGTLLAARDRFGKKPIFFFQNDDTLIFSSTIAAIHRYLGSKPRLRSEHLHSYLLTGKMFPDAGVETHIHDTCQLPTGHAMTFDFASWSQQVSAWHRLENATLLDVTDPDLLEDLLERAVLDRLVSDRQVGLFLSGGIDSTLILSVLHARGVSGQVRCFIGETGRSKDAEYARQCVAQLGIEATEVKLDYGTDTFQRFLSMCRHHEKGFPFLGNAMAMSEMYEYVARENVPVVLDGTGGDEIFAGYQDRNFPPALRQALKEADFGWLWETALGNENHRSHALRAFRDIPLKNSLWHLDLRQLRKNHTPLHRRIGIRSRSTRSADIMESPFPDFTSAMIADAAPGGRLGEWIWHNDRNAMMSGIENRSPLLDFRLIPFLGTAYHEKYQGKYNKFELRKQFDRFTQLPTQWRAEKQGFRWAGRNFLSENKDAILEMISSSACLGEHFNIPVFVDRAAKSRRTIRGSLTPRLLCLAGLEETIGLTL